MAFRLVAGLGNPGPEYVRTRHNAGFWVLDRWAAQEGVEWRPSRHADAMAAELPDGVLLLKPQTYMNASGEAVRDALAWRKWGVEELLVVVDDAALPLGRIRLRGSGSSGGHNGLRSVEGVLGTGNYARLRVGIGKPEGQVGLHGHVLGRIGPEEETILQGVVERSIEVIKVCRSRGLEAAMTLGNKNL
jgi:PTH1 family peptidyl-tRNA hydrolase